jgi:hypothetical protein
MEPSLDAVIYLNERLEGKAATSYLSANTPARHTMLPKISLGVKP